MAYVSIADVTKVIRDQLLANIPAELTADDLIMPNTSEDQPDSDHFVIVKIDFDDSQRVTAGVSEYELSGEIVLGVNSPTDIGTLVHESIVHQLRQVYDDNSDLAGTGFVVRFKTPRLDTVGNLNNFYQTDVIVEFSFREIV